MSIATIFKNGNTTFSFSRVAAFITILIGLALNFYIVHSALLGEPVIEAGKLITQTVIQDDGTALQVPVTVRDWEGLSEVIYNACFGTAFLVASLYGINKTAEAIGKFAEKKKA